MSIKKILKVECKYLLKIIFWNSDMLKRVGSKATAKVLTSDTKLLTGVIHNMGWPIQLTEYYFYFCVMMTL